MPIDFDRREGEALHAYIPQTPQELVKTGSRVEIGKDGRLNPAEVLVPPRFYKRAT